MFTIICKCGKTHRLAEQSAGSTIRCENCGATIVVPAKPNTAPMALPPTLTHKQHASKQPKPDGCLDKTHSVVPVSSGASQSPPSNESNYSIVRPFAKGGIGQISIARDESLRREVALKELQDGLCENTVCRTRFIGEAKITGQLEHPGVVPVYALGTDRDGRPFYAMRLVRGITLKEAIDSHHRAPTRASLRDLLRRFVMVCQTMAYAHTRGVVHRDLKPSNIMLGQFGETLVMDWGAGQASGRG